MSTDSVYQQLRAHLAYLKLGAAAEALPTQHETARTDKAGHTEFLERCWQSKSTHPNSAVGTPGCGSPTSPPPGPSTTSTSEPNPRSMRHSCGSWRPAATSTTPPTFCSSGRPASRTDARASHDVHFAARRQHRDGRHPLGYVDAKGFRSGRRVMMKRRVPGSK